MPTRRRLGLALTLAATLLTVSAPAALADGGSVAPGHWLWAWSLNPGVVLMLIGVAGLYANGVASLAEDDARRPSTAEVAAFTAGLATIALALLSPLDGLSGALSAPHMVQHLMLISVAAPLLALSRPVQPLLAALPSSLRRAVERGLRRVEFATSADGRLLLATALFTFVLWAWHLPGPYDAAVQSAPLHAAEHLTLLLAACAFWAALLPAGRGLALGVTFFMAAQCSALGAVLLLSAHPWYAAYVADAPSWGLTELQDQQLTGAIMWVPGGLVYLLAACWLFLRLLAESEPDDDGAEAPGAAMREEGRLAG